MHRVRRAFRLSFRSLRMTVLCSFLFLGLVPVMTVGLIAYQRSKAALQTVTEAQLSAVLASRKREVERYFTDSQAEMSALVSAVGVFQESAYQTLCGRRDERLARLTAVLRGYLQQMDAVADDRRFAAAVPAFAEAYEKGVASPQYEALRVTHGEALQKTTAAFGFEDLLIVSPAGRVVFAVAQGADLGAELLTGPLAHSGLGDAFRQARSGTALVDFSLYSPVGAPAAFLAVPIKTGEQLLGVVAFRLGVAPLNAIMTSALAGAGDSGQTYLVGADKRLRSDVMLDTETCSVAASFAGPLNETAVDTMAVQRALAGETGRGAIRNARGRRLLSAWAPVTVAGLQWALVAEIAMADAVAPQRERAAQGFYRRWAERLGYNDILLIDPAGTVFHSTSERNDLGTNLLTDRSSSTHLARLFTTVCTSQQMAVADFETYAPAGGIPEAFIAAALVQENELQLVVAAVLSVDRINGIMNDRSHTSASGETLLVGSDNRMRCDSTLDPGGHSVRASFLGTVEQNGVDIEATRAALAGVTGSETMDDYRGIAVLAAYAPLDVAGLHWAIVATEDSAVAFAPVRHLKWIMVSITVVSALVIAVLSLVIAQRLAAPIQHSVTVVAASAGEISATVSQIAAGSSQAVAAVAETSATVAEARQAARVAEERAHAVVAGAQNAAHASENGTQAMRHSVAGLDKISTQMASITASTQSLSECSRMIGDVITVVSDVADQSNLLALNASIQAAKAGEHGLGFAVVAREIRRLAHQSREATQQVRGMLNGIQKATNSVVLATAQGSRAVQEGQRLTDEAAGVISELAAVIGDAAQAAMQIAASSRQQFAGMEQVSSAMENIQSVSVQNRESTRQLTTAAENLREMGEQLRRVVEGTVAG